jgi:hypothetical protein
MRIGQEINHEGTKGTKRRRISTESMEEEESTEKREWGSGIHPI